MQTDTETTQSSQTAADASSAATAASSSRVLILILGTATIFAAAFLLFSLQPLVGKIVLPRFGGSAAVWSVCLVFFQTALLAGYILAYGIARLRPKQQLIAYPLLWLAAAFVATVPVGEIWRLTWVSAPAAELLWKLLHFVALPCVLVSSVSILVQVWARFTGVKDPYAFYAVSNVGSLGALLAYPTLIEPHLSVPASATAWTWAFRILALVILTFSVAIFRARVPVASDTESSATDSAAPSWRLTIAWMFLAAVGSGLLVSFTSRITQDIAPIPMLWIIPLSLYLLTFIVCFAGFYRREWILPFALVLFAVQTYVALHYLWPDLGFRRQAFGYTFVVNGIEIGLALAASAFFLLVLLVHGELYELRPPSQFLSRYYVAISAGGAIGGGFVSLAAPFLFKLQFEYPIFLGLALGVTLWVTFVHGVRLLQNFWLNLAVTLPLMAVCHGLTVSKMVEPYALQGDHLEIFCYRDLYGPMRVETASDRKVFLHGTTTHGTQLRAVDATRRPVSYYSVESAVGMVYQLFTEQEHRDPLKIGAVGLGVGTIAAYVHTPDMLNPVPGNRTVTFYELDPKVAWIAQTHFTFLKDAAPNVAVRLGDARTTLEQEPAQNYDMLIVDAFTGDGIPVHLLTREALDIYLRHINPNGAILFHISNRFLNLEPVIGNAAAAAGVEALTVVHESKNDDYDNSEYIVVSRRHLGLANRMWTEGGQTTVTVAARDPKLRVWTDDYSNLFSVLTTP